MVLITYWYDIPEVLDTGQIRKQKHSITPTLKSILLDNLNDTTTIEDVKNKLYQVLKVPPTHQALEQLLGKRKPKDPMKNEFTESSSDTQFYNQQLLVKDLGMTLTKTKQKTKKDSSDTSKAKGDQKPSFHLRTRIAVKDYQEVTGKFYSKFNRNGSYHRETIFEAMSNSFTSQLIFWMWKKHFITRLALVAFALVGLLSLVQSLVEVGARLGYEL
jgi:hypothetical protein